MDYSERELIDVFVSDLRTWIDKAGADRVSGQVTLTLDNPMYPHIAGPHVKARVSLTYDDADSLQTIEERLLDAAHALLRRLVDEPPENARNLFRRQRDDLNKPDPLAELQNG